MARSELYRTAALAIALALSIAAPAPCEADPQTGRHHAISLVAPPKHQPDFKHFDWVNPEAPKGGRIKLRGVGTFDTLNLYARTGGPALGLGTINDTLFVASLDEPSTVYGLVAEWVTYTPDYSSATFGLRPQARFHDGRPITPEDAIFSLEAIKAASPRYALYYKNVVKAEQTGPHEVTFTFEPSGNRELPEIVGGLPILPKHFWTGKDDKGQPRDLARGSLEIPLGSGPYRIRDFEAGRSIAYERVKDWWAKDLPVARGQWNFDEIAYIYYRDRLPAFEGFKAGETDFWPENSAKAWATSYEFDALARGLVRKEPLRTREMARMQGFAFNLRRKHLQDPRVRQAFNLAFNFEWFNKHMFYDQYTRVASYFENSELKAHGLPEGAELKILESVRDKVPPDVFTKAWANPVNKAPEDFRRNLAAAAKLIAEAGYTMKDGVMTGGGGDRLTVEFLLVQPDFERLVLAYKTELEKLGIRVDIRTVDSAQYRKRVETFDFDIVVASFPQSLSPGNEQREYWSTAAADQPNSQNIIGIKNPAVDALIERLIFATDRDDLVAATRALDRVLLWGHYLVPQFYSPVDRVAYWDRFGRPESLPGHAPALTSFLRIWWHDEAKATKLVAARK